MKHLVLIIFILSTTTVFSQEASISYNKSTNQAFPAQHSEPIAVFTNYEQHEGEELSNREHITYVRKAKTIPSNYTGFKVEILEKNYKLHHSAPVFLEFGKVMMEYHRDKYKYTIGEFKSAKSAENYADKIISHKYPTFKIIEYRKGKRFNYEISSFAATDNVDSIKFIQEYGVFVFSSLLLIILLLDLKRIKRLFKL